MKKRTGDTSSLDALRQQAEKRLVGEQSDVHELSLAEARRLVHELRTHQIELEIQNDELRRTQLALFESNDRYTHLYDFAPVGYVTVNINGLITEANLALADMLDVDRQRLIQQPLSAFILPEDQDLYYKHRKQTLGGTTRQTQRLQMQTPNKATFWAMMDSLPIKEKDSEATCLRTVIRDITELTNMEIREKESQQRLARAEHTKSLSVLAGGVAHDLNNMLGPLVALPGIIREDLKKITTAPRGVIKGITECLDVIQAAALRSAAVVQDLVHLGHCDRRDQDLLDINMIRHIRPEQPSSWSARYARPDIEFTEEQADGKLMILGDQSHLERAIDNLLRNSAEAIVGSGTVRIHTSRIHMASTQDAYEAIPAGDYALITIRDTGQGISPGDIDHIFDPFFTSKMKGERTGSGLGLSVVHGIVKEHEGFIDVVSEPDQGTTFSLYFPLADDVGDAAAAPDAPRSRPGTERILIVDDESSQRFLAHVSLQRLGYQATAAEGGRQALAFFEAARTAGDPSPFDLVILDMVMDDDYDGLRTCREIMALYSDQKVIIASGQAEDAHAAATKKLGASWLPKPYTIEALSEAVRDRLDSPTTCR